MLHSRELESEVVCGSANPKIWAAATKFKFLVIGSTRLFQPITCGTLLAGISLLHKSVPAYRNKQNQFSRKSNPVAREHKAAHVCGVVNGLDDVDRNACNDAVLLGSMPKFASHRSDVVHQRVRQDKTMMPASVLL